MSEQARRYRAGDEVEDRCRVCKESRLHYVISADPEGRPLRVICQTCDSQHNWRGGAATASPPGGNRRTDHDSEPATLVSERERSLPPMSLDSESVDLELLLRRVIREECGITPSAPAERWRGGELVLRAGRPGVQEKSWPVETFFHKIVMLRNRLRVLEQQINGSGLDPEQKLKLQSYITGCYGTLTSFNVLFADDDDRFKGASGKD